MPRQKLPIYYITFPSRYFLASTFLRFQEYLDSPKFKNKYFTLEEYMDWYAKETGDFTYYKDWDGFNIPSHVLEPFYRGKFDPLSKKEERFLELFKDIKGNFYIIGTERGDLDLLGHEIVHPLFHLVDVVRKAVLDYFKNSVRSPDLKKTFSHTIYKASYNKKTFLDEMNAYAVGGPLGDPPYKKINAKVKRNLRDIFRRHFRFNPLNKEKLKQFLIQIHVVEFNLNYK